MQQSPSFVYMVRCQNGSLYSGWTNDLEHRITAHRSGRGAKYTRAFGAAELAYAQALEDKSQALRREAQLKKLPKAEKEALAAQWASQRLPRLRAARPQDAPGLLAIYGWYVQNTCATLQWKTPAPAEYEKWVRDTLRRCPFLLAEDETGRVLGFACAHPYHPRESFDWSAETTIYLAPDARGQGLGEPLYHGLLALLRQQGYHRAYAVLADPNPGSESFHARMGFQCVARVPGCAYKFGQWQGISTWALALRPNHGPPQPLQKKVPAARQRQILAGAWCKLPWQQLCPLTEEKT